MELIYMIIAVFIPTMIVVVIALIAYGIGFIIKYNEKLPPFTMKEIKKFFKK